MLLDTLKRLRDLGNTLIVVEHDEDTMRAADYIVDIGPAAGVHGGQVIAAGTAEEIMAVPASITGQYLSGAKKIPVPPAAGPANGTASPFGGCGEQSGPRGRHLSPGDVHLRHRCVRFREVLSGQ